MTCLRSEEVRVIISGALCTREHHLLYLKGSKGRVEDWPGLARRRVQCMGTATAHTTSGGVNIVGGGGVNIATTVAS